MMDLVEIGKFPAGYQIGCEKMSAIYIQESDGNDSEYQQIEITAESCGGDPYFTIKTERWAFDNIDELIMLLKNFKNKTGIKND